MNEANTELNNVQQRRNRWALTAAGSLAVAVGSHIVGEELVGALPEIISFVAVVAMLGSGMQAMDAQTEVEKIKSSSQVEQSLNEEPLL